MADDDRWKDWFRSWSDPGRFAHPDSPAGGSGPGFSRPPGSLGLRDSGPLLSSVPHPDSPAGRHFAWSTELPRRVSTSTPTPGPAGIDQSVAGMSHQQKMAEAIRRAYDRGLISKEIMRQLPSVEELAIGIVVVGGVLVGLGVAAGAVASTGVGAVLEAIAAGIVLALAAIGIISSAKQVIAGIKVLVKFYTATEGAASYPELDTAGRDFAEGIAEVGVGTVMMILSYLGARQGLKMGKGALSKWDTSKEAASKAGAKPKIGDPNAAQWRYQRYKAEKESAGEQPLPYDQWKARYYDTVENGGRPGRRGNPAHEADVEQILEDNPTARPGAEVGGRVPDAAGQPGEPMQIRGRTITPEGDGRVIVESDHTVYDGRLPDSAARSQVRDMRAAEPSSTLVVTDCDNPSAPPLVYPPGTQPPPSGRLGANPPARVPYP